MNVAVIIEGGQNETVCYRCQYIGIDTGQNRCPKCGFPLIVEHGYVSGEVLAVREIFDRTSVSINAPPLPGVDGRPRKAELIANARRKRRLQQQQAANVARVARVARAQQVRYPRLKVACAFVSALFAGLGMALLMNGGL